VIVDVVNYAVAGIDFIQAVGRVVVRKRFSAGVNTVMTQKDVTQREQCGEQDTSVLTEAS
jgi:hypothetical protein